MSIDKKIYYISQVLLHAEKTYDILRKYKRKVFIIANIPPNFMDGFDKKLVEAKLREMGMEDIASKLNNLSDMEIERMIRSNPAILQKASEILKGGNPFK